MDQDQTERMTPFDELVTSPTLQIMKLLIPYTPFSGRRMLDTLIQLKEMMSFMEMMQPQDGQGNDSFNPADLFSGIFPADLQEQFHMYSDLFSSVSQNQEHDETDAQQKKENEL